MEIVFKTIFFFYLDKIFQNVVMVCMTTTLIKKRNDMHGRRYRYSWAVRVLAGQPVPEVNKHSTRFIILNFHHCRLHAARAQVERGAIGLCL